MKSPRYSRPANHTKTQIRKAFAIHRDREPEAANMMRNFPGQAAPASGRGGSSAGVSMDRSALRGADVELSDHCQARYTIAPLSPKACSRKMTIVFRLAAALLAAVASGEAIAQQYPARAIPRAARRCPPRRPGSFELHPRIDPPVQQIGDQVDDHRGYSDVNGHRL